MEIQDVVLCVARALVLEPRRAEAEEFDEDGTTVVELSVAPDDRGRVIGRRGRTANAIRTLVGAIARRQGLRFDLEIMG